MIKFCEKFLSRSSMQKLTVNPNLILKTITTVFFALFSSGSNSQVIFLSSSKTGEQKVQLAMNTFSDGHLGTMRYRRQRSNPIFSLLSHGASTEQGDHFYQEKLGTCFKDINQFIRNVIGEYAANDQNLISTKKGS